MVANKVGIYRSMYILHYHMKGLWQSDLFLIDEVFLFSKLLTGTQSVCNHYTWSKVITEVLDTVVFKIHVEIPKSFLES